MRRLLPVVTAALVLLVGCSADDDPEPRIAPTDSSSAASTTAPPPSPTGPVEPTLPAEAAGEDAAAAEAFVRYFWAAVNHAQATGDVRTLQTLGTDTCAACAGGVESIEKTYLAGGTMDGGAITVDALKSEPYESGPSRGFLVTADTTAESQKVTVPGKKGKTYPGGQSTIRLIVERSDGRWQVARMDPI